MSFPHLLSMLLHSINPLITLNIHYHIFHNKIMGKIKTFGHLRMLFAIALAIVVKQVNGQSTDSSAICTGAMIRSFSPCLGYLAFRSTASSPSAACCNSLKSLMSNGQDCLCLMITGGSSLQVPLNQTLAMSLPRACRTSGVPIECKAISPAPAPGQGNRGQGGSNMSPGRVSPSPGDTAGPGPGPNPSAGSQGQGGSYTPPPGLVNPPFGGSNNPQTPSGGFITPPGPTTQGGGGVGSGRVIPNLTPPGMRPTLTQSATHDKSHHALSITLWVAVFGVISILNLY